MNHVLFPCWDHGDSFGGVFLYWVGSMILVGKRLLVDFAQRHASARDAVSAWISEVEAASWRSGADVRARFASASVVGNSRVVFNLKGNRFRLVAEVNYSTQIVLVRRIGTHAEYDSWTF